MVEFLIGVILMALVFVSYDGKWVIGNLVGNKLIGVIIAIILILISARLLGGKPKEYSSFFYNLLVKIRVSKVQQGKYKR